MKARWLRLSSRGVSIQDSIPTSPVTYRRDLELIAKSGSTTLTAYRRRVQPSVIKFQCTKLTSQCNARDNFLPLGILQHSMLLTLNVRGSRSLRFVVRYCSVQSQVIEPAVTRQGTHYSLHSKLSIINLPFQHNIALARCTRLQYVVQSLFRSGQ